MSGLYHPVRNKISRVRGRRAVRNWERRGRPAPPPDKIKQDTVREYARKYDISTFVETGLLLGDMIEAVKSDFKRVFSIELDGERYQRATERFEKDRHVELIQGDSGKEIANVLNRLDRPTVFWLDAHDVHGYQTAVYDELASILDAPDLGHIVLIDDARLFGWFEAYGTVDELKELVLARRPDLDIAVEYDIIRITPSESSG
jgi:hypothetical protein